MGIKLTNTSSKSLDEIKQEKINSFDNKCEKNILNGFISESTTFKFSFSAYDQMNFTQQMLLIIADQSINQIFWKTEDQGVKVFTREQFLGICYEAEQHKRNNIGKLWTLKAKILNAVSIGEINNLMW